LGANKQLKLFRIEIDRKVNQLFEDKKAKQDFIKDQRALKQEYHDRIFNTQSDNYEDYQQKNKFIASEWLAI
jgi:hypothetical protein